MLAQTRAMSCGSKPEVTARYVEVRFTLETGHAACILECPLSAMALATYLIDIVRSCRREGKDPDISSPNALE